MLLLIIDACILLTLVKMFVDEDAGFLGAIFLSLATSIGISLLLGGLAVVIGGLASILVSTVIGSAILGCAVSTMYGTDFKTGTKIAAIFLVVHLACVVGLHFLLQH